MTRYFQSGKKSRRVAEVLTDHGSALGKLLKRGSLLMQMQHLLAGCLDPAVAAQFQVADVRRGKVVLVTPTASWATLLRMQASNLVETLRRALADGTIDAIQSGHMPRSREKKMNDLDQAPFGAASLETTLATIITYMIKEGSIDWLAALDQDAAAVVAAGPVATGTHTATVIAAGPVATRTDTATAVPDRRLGWPTAAT